MSTLNLPGLAQCDLADALKWLADDMSRHCLSVAFPDDGKRKVVPLPLQAVLFQSVREVFV